MSKYVRVVAWDSPRASDGWVAPRQHIWQMSQIPKSAKKVFIWDIDSKTKLPNTKTGRWVPRHELSSIGVLG